MNLYVWVYDGWCLNNVYVYYLKLENEIFLWSVGNLKDIFF